MPSVTEEARARLRETRRTAAPRRPSWSPPAVCDFARGRRVLAFDASLSNTGWVLFIITDREVVVERKGTIRPGCAGNGYLGTWQRAGILRGELYREDLVYPCMRNPEVLKAVEAPPVGVGMHRTESSLMAGAVVWMECDECEDISPVRVSRVLLGDARIRSDGRKPAVRKAVARYVPAAAGRTWNEHERDALSVGLVRLFGLREEQS